MPSTKKLVASALAGQRGPLARLLSIAEHSDERLLEIEDCIDRDVGRALVVGITGPPGAGKSTLINSLLPLALSSYPAVAVLAVDPSSPLTKGALLGDRVRMHCCDYGSNVFVRSMASRGQFGGLARAASSAVRIFDACGWPLIFVETLGIGQVELDIMDLADTTVVVLNPLWGDSIQANKAGLTECGDVFVINKADKPGTNQTKRDLLDSLALLNGDRIPPVLESVASSGDGAANVWKAIRDHQAALNLDDLLSRRRAVKRRRLVRKLVTDQVLNHIDRLFSTGFADQLIGDATPGQIRMTDTLSKMLEKLLDNVNESRTRT